jgi:DNA-binding transcriptional LysR family regulator
LPRAHALADRTDVALADLAGMTFADFPAGTSGRAQSDGAFRAADVERDVAFEADSAELILGLVAAELAVSLLAPGVVAGWRGEVIAVPIRRGPIRVEYVAWDKDAPRSVARAFLRVVETAVPTHRGGPGKAPGPASQ